MRDSISVTIVAMSNCTLGSALIRGAAVSYGLYDTGAAWIVLASPSGYVDQLVGTLFLEQLSILPPNVPSFLTLLSGLPGAYTSIAPHSPQLNDAIQILGNAIFSSSTSSVTRMNILTALNTTDYTGLDGLIQFDATGFRNNSAFQLSNVMPVSGTVTGLSTNVTHLYDSGTYISLGVPVVFPGGVSAVPNSQANVFTIASFVSFGHQIWPDNTTNEVYGYFLDAVNGVRNVSWQVPVMPSGSRLRTLFVNTPTVMSELIPSVAALINSGIVGGCISTDSTTTILVENILSPYSIPLLSSAASSPMLSNKTLYPTFLRSIPPDDFQGIALLQLCLYYGWTEIGVIYSTDAYGIGTSQVVQQQADDLGINISTIASIDPTVNTNTDELRTFAVVNPRIVFVLTGSFAINQLILDMMTVGITPHAVIGSDAVASALYTPAQFGINPASLMGWIATTPSGGFGPSWELFKQEVVATFPAYNGVRLGYEQNPAVMAATFDPVLMYADSISRLLHANQDPRNLTTLLGQLFRVNGTWLTGELHLNANGDRLGAYDIISMGNNAIGVAGRITYDGQLTLYNAIVWPDGTTNVPLAVLPRNVQYLAWNSAAGIVLVVLAIIGILVSVFMFGVMLQQRNSPIIRVATWEFLLLMLFGCAVGFGSVLTWVGQPKPYICALRIWIPPMAFVLIMAPLLTKTWRLHRIFTLASLRAKPFPLSHLVAMCSIIGAIQLLICIFWISMGTIKPTIINDTHDKTVAYAVCGSIQANRIASYVTYGYLGFIMLIGCYVTFKVRKLPKDFNESRWIGFSIYNTFLFSIIIIILGYALKNFPVTVLILICVCTLAICTGALAFMLVPKLWTLLMHPETRSSSNSNKSGTATTPSGYVFHLLSLRATDPLIHSFSHFQSRPKDH